MSVLSDVIDVVEHLVNTHSNWNQDLSKDEAKAKLVAARVADAAGAAVPVVQDVAETAADASTGAVEPTMADVEKLLADAEALRKKVEGK